jgi:hypothetical protein
MEWCASRTSVSAHLEIHSHYPGAYQASFCIRLLSS